MHLGAGHTYATAVCPSPCLRIALVEMDPVPPSVLHLPPPLPREQVQAAAATFHCQRAPRLHRTEQHQPTHLSPTLPFLCCRTDWDRAAWLIQACSHPVLLHLLPAPSSHPSCREGRGQSFTWLIQVCSHPSCRGGRGPYFTSPQPR